MSIACEANCGRWFTSIGSMNSHLSKARSCAWYKKGKLRELGLDNLDNLSVPALCEPEDGNDLENYDPQQDLDLDIDFGPYERELIFFHLTNLRLGMQDLGHRQQKIGSSKGQQIHIQFLMMMTINK